MRCGLTLRPRGRICWTPWFMMECMHAFQSRAQSELSAHHSQECGKEVNVVCLLQHVVVVRVPPYERASERGPAEAPSQNLGKRRLEIELAFHFTSLTRAHTAKDRVYPGDYLQAVLSRRITTHANTYALLIQRNDRQQIPDLPPERTSREEIQ
jgi:hypothetical protein